MKNNTQRRGGVLAAVLLASAFSTPHVFAKFDKDQSLEIRGLDLRTSAQLDGVAADNIILCDQQKTSKDPITVKSIPTCEGYEFVIVPKAKFDEGKIKTALNRLTKPSWGQRVSTWCSDFAAKVNPWAKSAAKVAAKSISSAAGFTYEGFTNYVVPGAIEAGKLAGPVVVKAGKFAGRALIDGAWQLSPQAFHDGYARAYADTVAYQQQGYSPSASFALVTLLHPACWLGNQVFSENTMETSYVNLHNLAILCGNGAMGGAELSKTSYHAGGKYSFVPVLGGGVAYVGLGLPGAGLWGIAQLGHEISTYGVYLPTPVVPQQQAVPAT